MVHTVPTLRGAGPKATSAVSKQQKDVSPASSGRVTNATDDSDGLVTTQRGVAGARRPIVAEKFTMTGALGEEETRLRPPSKRTIEEVSRIAREAEYASTAADRRTAHATAARQSINNIQTASSLPGQAATRGGQMGSSAGTSAVHSRRPSIVSKGQQTPLGQSSLGAAMFKKRPRQPSLLQTAQSQNLQSELDDDNASLDDFRPDDESTPLVKSLIKSHALGSSSSRQLSSGSRKRKLASPEVQVPASQSEATLGSPSASEVPSQPLAQEDASQPVEGLEEEPESPEPVLPSQYASQIPAPEIFSDTLAPPQSSSSPPSKAKRRSTRKAPNQAAPKSKTLKQSHNKNSSTTRSTDTTTTISISPVRQPLKPLTTATLQNLLPRRRIRHRAQKGAYDFPSSSDAELDTTALGEDEDELSFHAAKMRRKTKTPARTMQLGKKATGKVSAKQHQTPAPVEKEKRISKTYTRKSLVESDVGSGDEDEDEDEDDSLMPVKTKGKRKLDGEFDPKAKKEMERLARKFAEVDDYVLDFEDMTGSSSQMLDAR